MGVSPRLAGEVCALAWFVTAVVLLAGSTSSSSSLSSLPPSALPAAAALARNVAATIVQSGIDALVAAAAAPDGDGGGDSGGYDDSDVRTFGSRSSGGACRPLPATPAASANELPARAEDRLKALQCELLDSARGTLTAFLSALSSPASSHGLVDNDGSSTSSTSSRSSFSSSSSCHNSSGGSGGKRSSSSGGSDSSGGGGCSEPPPEFEPFLSHSSGATTLTPLQLDALHRALLSSAAAGAAPFVEAGPAVAVVTARPLLGRRPPGDGSGDDHDRFL
jgi:hypothetical protein